MECCGFEEDFGLVGGLPWNPGAESCTYLGDLHRYIFNTSDEGKWMKIGVPKEIKAFEYRVAATPDSVTKLLELGYEVVVESGAGGGSSFSGGSYREVGATIAPNAEAVWSEADFVIKVRAPQELPDGKGHELDWMREGTRLLSFIWPTQKKELVEKLAAKKATVLAMDKVPRITRAQKLDALSSMANISGYRAVVEAANQYGGFFAGQVTAAGRTKPAEVLVIGAGVAGLAALGAARSLGAVVRAFDTREATREQVQSLGGKFIAFEFEESGEGEGGYAKQMSDAFLKAEQDLLAQHASEVDIIITTALIPGKPAPVLITPEAARGMRAGSVIVDLAAERGGNCPLSEADKIVTKDGVTFIGMTNLPSRMPRLSSQMYATNITHFLDEATQEGALTLDLEDEIQRGMLILHDGEMMWPPPKREAPVKKAAKEAPKGEVAKSAPPAPKVKKTSKSSKKSSHGSSHSPEPKPPSTAATVALGIFCVALIGLGFVVPKDFLQHLTVFLLACVVGWHVVWNVSPALHTPLMSVTNAISGIILIGGMLLIHGDGFTASGVLGMVAVLIASINVAGGFLVTQRMLRMFRK